MGDMTTTTASRFPTSTSVTGRTMYGCPTPGCQVFPYFTEAEVEEHLAEGDHVIRSASGRFESVDNGFGGTTTRKVDEAPRPTEKQTAFIRSLLAERAGLAQAEDLRSALNLHRERGTLTRKVVSEAITALLSMPKVAPPADNPSTGSWVDRAAFRAVPAGRYAVGETLLKWDVVEGGRWDGYVFVKRLQAVETGETETLDDGTEAPILDFVEGPRVAISNPTAQTVRIEEGLREAIEAVVGDPTAAAVAFGRKTVHCGICGRVLRKKVSRERGIGPVCWEKYGG